jgi:multiple sugar transport system substrate-binding protein
VILTRAEIPRRTVLRAIAGAGGAAAGGSLIAACTTLASTPRPVQTIFVPPTATPPPGGPISLGSGQSEPAPRQALQQVVDAFTAATGVVVKVTTVAEAAFQDQIASYLAGRPDDVFTWFAGYEMRSFARNGLAADLTDVWRDIGADFTDAIRRASSSADGTPIFIPFATQPWVFIYRRSLWESRRYQVPRTWQQLLTLTDRMRFDGLVPIAFGDKDGWLAMGYFDILNMRLNGYDFHIGLLDGRQMWRDPKVKAVFEQWRQLLPSLQPAALDRTWQEAAMAMANGDAGLYFGRTDASEQATEEQRTDLEVLEFPALGTPFDAEKAIDAPVDGFMMSPKPGDPAAAKSFLRFLGSGHAQDLFITANPRYVAVANDALRSDYSLYQRRMLEIISGAGRIAQFMDRDTRPDFAGPTGMQAFLQDFLAAPDQDLDPLLGRIQDFWDSLPSPSA